MLKKLLILALLSAAPSAFAQNTIFNSPSNGYPGGSNSYSPNGSSNYDSRSGSSYQSYGSGYQGSNTNTGSSWGAQTYDGVTRGTDSQGNSWSFDRNTGLYENYGTGETRSHGSRY